MSKENRDYLKKQDYPKQTYAFSGMDFADASIVRTNGKLEIFGTPMAITPMPPGAFAYDDDVWQQVYGASCDAVLSLLDGSKLAAAISYADSNVPSDAVYRDTLFHAINSNLYDLVEGYQQVQYVVSKDTVAEAEAAIAFGDVEEARSLGLRGPLHMAGWGKTICLRPTDPIPQGRDNDDKHKLDRSSWKYGPLDVRWDEVRGCWRAWNDIIADTNGQNLGTPVFGTNPDPSFGFPYIRGKIEDVWEVRRTVYQEGTPLAAVKASDSAKSAEVMTITSHRLLDGDNAGPLSDIFTVNLDNGPGSSLTVGAEITSDGLLAIKTTAQFDSTINCGPISFVDVVPLGISLGHLYWDNGTWRPGFTAENINICSLANEEFSILYGNDLENASAIEEIGFEAFDWLLTLDGLLEFEVVGSIEGTANAFFSVQNQVNTNIVNYINGTLLPDIASETQFLIADTSTSIMASVESALTTYAAGVQAAIQAAFVAIVQSLSENCDCTIAIPEITIPPPGLPAIFVNEMSFSSQLEEIDIHQFISDLHDTSLAIAEELAAHPGKPDIAWDMLEPCGTDDRQFAV